VRQASARWRAIPENREAHAQYMRQRWANDPAFRKAQAEAQAEWRATPENRETLAKRHKERYDNDPEYRERLKQNSRERYWKMKFGLATSDRHKAQDVSDSPEKSDGPDAKS